MRSFVLIVAAGLMLEFLPIVAVDTTVGQPAIPYNSDVLRSAIADGMSRAGATLVRAESEAAEDRH